MSTAFNKSKQYDEAIPDHQSMAHTVGDRIQDVEYGRIKQCNRAGTKPESVVVLAQNKYYITGRTLNRTYFFERGKYVQLVQYA